MHSHSPKMASWGLGRQFLDLWEKLVGLKEILTVLLVWGGTRSPVRVSAGVGSCVLRAECTVLSRLSQCTSFSGIPEGLTALQKLKGNLDWSLFASYHNWAPPPITYYALYWKMTVAKAVFVLLGSVTAPKPRSPAVPWPHLFAVGCVCVISITLTCQVPLTRVFGLQRRKQSCRQTVHLNSTPNIVDKHLI